MLPLTSPLALVRLLVEILVLTVIVHRVILIFRSGRATGILFTLVFLGLIFFAASLLQMRVVVWIFRELAPILGIVLVIVFQPEIRKALERSGNMGAVLATGLRGRTEEAKRIIDILVRAAEEFSERRIGALMVIEIGTPLDSYIETGESIDARLSPDLLESIFLHTSPLHDGAVIIRGGRLVAARCYLPLTENTELPAYFGTRHRAAVGLSELTDAMILVVSEETGRMSIVHLGRVAEGLTPVALKYQMQSILSPSVNVASPVDARPDREDEERAGKALLAVSEVRD